MLMKQLDDDGAMELWARDVTTRAEVESALTNAVIALRGREGKKTGVEEKPLCMVVALVLEAIQQNFYLAVAGP